MKKFFVISVFVILLSAFVPGRVYADSSGPIYTGTGANFNDGGNTAWTNPTNVQGDTTSTAATVSLGTNGHSSQRLRASNFSGLNIPDGAFIDGVEVEVEAGSANNNRHYWNSVRLLVAGAETGFDKSDGSAINGKSIKTFGASTDDWGAGLTSANVNDTGFGVSFKVARSGNATTTSLYRARITVYYTPAVTISGNIYASGSESTTNATSVSVSVSVNNGAPTTVIAQTSNYSVNVPGLSAGNPVAVYIDGHATLNATAFTVASGSTITNLHLYIDKTAIYNHNSGSTTNSHVCTTQSTYPTSGDRTYACPGSNVLTATASEGSGEIHVAGNYVPGANVNASKMHIISGGTFNAGSNTLTLSGSGTGTSRPLYIDSGTFTASTGTTAYTGGADTDLQVTTYYNLTINGTGPYSVGGGFTISRELLISSGTLSLTTSTVTVGSTGVTNSGSIKVASGGILSGGSSVVVLSSSSGSNCIGADGASCAGTPGTIGLNNLTIGNASTTFTTTLAGTTPSMTISGVLTITSNATYAQGAGSTTTLSGSGTPLVKNGSITISASGATVKYTSGTGVTALASSGTGIMSYDTLIIEGSGTFNAGLRVDANRSLTVTSGTLAMGANDLYIGSGSIANSGTLKVASGASLTQSTSNLTAILSSNGGFNCIGGTGSSCSGSQGTISFGDLVVGDGTNNSTTTMAGDAPVISISGTSLGLYVNGTGTLRANGTINLSTDFYHATGGVFTPNSSTVNLTGTGGSTQIISGSVGTTFYNLSATASTARTIKFVSGLTTTISNSLTLTGSAGELLSLQPETTETQWFIDPPPGNVSVSYVNVNYSTSAECINATNSTGANNELWDLDGNNCIAYSTRYSFQRKTWYDGTYYWKSFATGSAIEFWYSDDGSSWTQNSSATITTSEKDYSLEADNNGIFIVYSGSYDILGRKGSSYPSISFGWGTEQVVLNGTSSVINYSYPVIARDSSGYVWVGARYRNNTVYYFQVIKETAEANDLPEYSSDSVITISDISNTSNNVYGNIVSLGSQNMYAVFASGTSIQGCRWVNSVHEWQNESGVSCQLVAGNTPEYIDSSAGSAAFQTSLSVDKPTGTAENDLLISAFTVTAGYTGMGDLIRPSGWSFIEYNESGLPDVYTEIYMKVAGASEPSSYTWSWDGGINAAAIVSTYRGADLAYPIQATSGLQGRTSEHGSNGEIVAPSLNSVTVNNRIALFYSTDAGEMTGIFSAPSGSTEREQVVGSAGLGDARLMLADFEQSVVGATGDKTATYPQNVDYDRIGQQVAIRSEFVSGTQDEIATTISGITTTLSVVADQSGNVHLVYIDGSGNSKYQKRTTAWQTAVALDANSGNAYPSITYNTNNNDLYAFWIRGDDIYYKKSVTPYASGDWDVSATSWKTTGTNEYISSNYSGDNKVFAQWYDGAEVLWDILSLGGSNTSPSTPTLLFVNERQTGAGSGELSPVVAVGDGTPVFSAVYADTDEGDVAGMYEVIVYSDSGCTSQVWDSGSEGTAMTNCTEGNRCGDITFGGSALMFDGGSYYWKIRYWDDEPSAGSFSSCADTFSMLGPENQLRHGNYFFNNATRSVFTW